MFELAYLLLIKPTPTPTAAPIVGPAQLQFLNNPSLWFIVAAVFFVLCWLVLLIRAGNRAVSRRDWNRPRRPR